MVFETLYEAQQKNELLLINGGMCHWHLRKDGQVTIREIFSTRSGAGTKMINILLKIPGATSLFAKCPEDLPSNFFYEKLGFVLEGKETTSSGRVLNLWRMLI